MTDDTAWKLFGTREAEGRQLVYGEKTYQVRQVLPWKAEDDPDPSGERRNRVYQSISEKLRDCRIQKQQSSF